MDRISKIWFIDWWMQTQNAAAKLLVIQAVGVKIASVVAIVCLAYLGIWIIETAAQIVPFRIWSNTMYTRNFIPWPAVTMGLLAVSVVIMGKCNV